MISGKLFFGLLASGVLILGGCQEKDVPDTPQVPDSPVAEGANAPTPPAEESESAPAKSAAVAEPAAPEMDAPQMAVAVLQPVGDNEAKGTVYFTQEGDAIHVTGTITGLSPGKHGFHVHEFGDVSNSEDGTSAGGHFNPDGEPHGAADADERHVGDLGNIEADESGTAKIDMTDDVIKLSGPHSILGRSLMVHVGEDKFTQPTGDAGEARACFGVIGIANPKTASP